MIGSSSARVWAAIASGRVMMAVASADAHSHVRGHGSRATTSRMTAWAVAAFSVRFATIISTVTSSWAGCQQS